MQNLNVVVVTLSTQDNVKLLDQLKSGFKRTINWNKYQSKATIQTPYQYLDSKLILIDILFYHLKIMYTEQVTNYIFFQQ